MKFEQLLVLLPCYSLEDLSLDRESAEAEGILSAWSALYHPVLVASAGSPPQWSPASSPSPIPSGKLFVIPACSEPLLPHTWLAQAETAGASVIRGGNRAQVVAQALERLDGEIPAVPPELVDGFLALGFCHFLVELLTRKHRYMSNLDESQFRQRLLAAASEAVKGATEDACERLRGAFDLLTEAREYFYPSEARLFDLTLVAPTTVGASLRSDLSRPGAVNLMLSGKTLEEMAAREPETLALLKERVENQTATILGGEWDEAELPLLPLEEILSQLRRGLSSYEQHLGCRPTVFARRRFGLTPLLPQVLRKLGFVGALHFTLEDGRFPTNNQSKIAWEGLDGTTIPTLARLPLDASQSRTFLQLPETLGRAMDLDHAATLTFAHWPAQARVWHDDLRHMANHSPALGNSESMADCFSATEYVGQTIRFTADQYRSPYLRQEVESSRPNPISRWVRYLRRRSIAEAAATMETLASLVSQHPSTDEAPVVRFFQEIDQARSDPADDDGLDDRLSARLEAAKQAMAKILVRQTAESKKGCLVFNPWSFSQRRLVDVSDFDRLPAPGGPVWLADEAESKKTAVVDVPAMGFAYVESGPEAAASPAPSRKQKKRAPKSGDPPPLAEGNFLRNDFFQVELNPITGAIQSIRDFGRRSNRIGQQLAYRAARSLRSSHDDRSDDEAHYTIMAADEIRVLSSGPVVGEMIIRGRLMDREGQLVARFAETIRVQRGSRVVELDIELEPEREPEPDPWNSYYGARFAWGDDTMDLYRSLHLASVASEIAQIEAPHFIDLREDKTRTTILTGGLPYHRRFGLRKLDSLLIVRGESARRFRLGIGIDLPYPVPAALGFLAPDLTLPGISPPARSSGWFFHLNAKNVVATAWEPIYADQRVSGVRVRLQETEGRHGPVALRTFLPPKSARKFAPASSTPLELSPSGDQITLAIGAYEWVELEIEMTNDQ